MKKTASAAPQASSSPSSDASHPASLPVDSTHVASHIFTIHPNVDTPSLLVHAAETLASLNVMSTDFAFEFEGSRRNVALGIQQLASLAELLVNRALDNLDPPSRSLDTPMPSNH